MSIENLAARLDALDGQGAFVTEAEDGVTASNLDAGVAREIMQLTQTVGWVARAFDGAGSEWDAGNLEEAFEPFRVTIDKPQGTNGALRLLTNVGFAAWLEREDRRTHWEVARLSATIEASGVVFTPWYGPTTGVGVTAPFRSPRTLVREFSGQREVPAGLERWLLRGDVDLPLADASVAVWANAAIRKLILALPDEFDAQTRVLRFKGPPRLDLTMPDAADDAVHMLKADGWSALQRAAQWVFEIDREAEMRHILLATELARCGSGGDVALTYLRANLLDAHDAARTAYQAQLAGISSDALKTLSELRKSVTDETAKVADATRQIITAVAGALAVGVGLIAARLTTTTSPLVIILVMLIAGAYVAITIVSGVLFTLLQRRVRTEWQPRLYRFLSKQDYMALVGRPARMAERALWLSSFIGGGAVILMAIVLWSITPADTSTSLAAKQTNNTSKANLVTPIEIITNKTPANAEVKSIHAVSVSKEINVEPSDRSR